MRNLGFKVLTEEEVYEIHAATMEVLEKVGVSFQNKEARQILGDAGAKVTSKNEVVKIPFYLIEEALRKCAPIVELYGRDGSPPLRIGGKAVYFPTQGYPARMLDWRNDQYRKPTMKDLVETIRLADMLDSVDYIMPPCSPCDVPSDKEDQYQWKIALMNTRKPILNQAYEREGVRKAVMMSEKFAKSREDLLEKPFIVISPTIESPLQHNRENLEVIMETARFGIPLSLSSGPMSGVNAPATLAATLVCTNAENLSGILLAKLVNPNVPILYTSWSRIFDMKSSNVSLGCPEAGLLRIATTQLAQYYNLPSVGSGLITDSKVPDEQAGCEKLATGLLAALAGTNAIVGMGQLDAGGLMSAEALVIDDEIVRYIHRVLNGISVDNDRLAVEVFKKVGPGKDFLTEEHTLKYFRKEMWIPELSDRQSFGAWDIKGQMNIRIRAKEVIAKKLKEHQPFPLPRNIETELDDIIKG